MKAAITQYIDAYGLDLVDLAAELDEPIRCEMVMQCSGYLVDVLDGKAAVTPELARKLEAKTGRPAQFWLELNDDQPGSG